MHKRIMETNPPLLNPIRGVANDELLDLSSLSITNEQKNEIPVSPKSAHSPPAHGNYVPSTFKINALSFDPLMNTNSGSGSSSLHKPNESTLNGSSCPIYPKSRSLGGTDFSEYLTAISPQRSSHSRNQGSADFSVDHHMLTLGSDMNHSTLKTKKNTHKRWSSYDQYVLNSFDLGDVRESMKVKSASTRSASQPVTPQQQRKQFVGNPKSPPQLRSHQMSDSQHILSNQNVKMPTLKQHDLLNPIFNIAPSTISKRVAPDTSFLNQKIGKAYQTKLRTSELEPSPHQVELPASKEIMVYAHLCSLMEDYRVMNQNFNFKELIGVPHMAIENFVSSGVTTPLSAALRSEYLAVYKIVLNCGDDLVVEDFLQVGEDVASRIEVTIFRSDTQRQIIAVWRGSNDGQTKPIRNRELRAIHGVTLKDGMLPSFQLAYNKGDLQSRLFKRLEKIMEENPFFDLVTTGFSQGAALATICASKYASSYPMMRVSCSVFGCPKIGGEHWRNECHSLPNLKIIRVQIEDDSFADAPSEPHFTHVGHTILLCSGSSSIAKSSSPDSPKSSGKKGDMKALAFKFDKPAHTKSKFFKIKKQSSHPTFKAYMTSLNQFLISGGLPWVTEYVGENVGTGVHGMKNEQRSMV